MSWPVHEPRSARGPRSPPSSRSLLLALSAVIDHRDRSLTVAERCGNYHLVRCEVGNGAVPPRAPRSSENIPRRPRPGSSSQKKATTSSASTRTSRSCGMQRSRRKPRPTSIIPSTRPVNVLMAASTATGPGRCRSRSRSPSRTRAASSSSNASRRPSMTSGSASRPASTSPS